MKKKILLLIVASIFYLLGAITVQYKLFSFDLIVSFKNRIIQNFTPNYKKNITIQKSIPDYKKNIKYKLNIGLYEIYKTKKINIVMLGDSLTYKLNWNELFNMPIINRGIGSDTIEGFVNRMDFIYKLKPKKVFIMGGVNDISLGYKVDDIFRNYKIILNELKEHNITAYVQSTLLTTLNSRNKRILNSAKKHNVAVDNKLALVITQNAKIIELNTLLKKYCETNSIHFIDLNKKLSKNNQLLDKYTLDGVHLNANGYKVWKELIQDYIKSSWE